MERLIDQFDRLEQHFEGTAADTTPSTEASGSEDHPQELARPTPAKKNNLFFALYPPAPIRKALTAAAGPPPPQARTVASDNLHMTLLFLGPQDDEAALRLATLPLETSAFADCRPFSLVINTPGRFPKAGVSWLGPKKWPAELGILIERLQAISQGMNLLPLAKDGRPNLGWAFRPHITVFRRSRWLPAKPLTPIHWEVDWLFLLRSTSPSGQAAAGDYSVLADWPLDGPQRLEPTKPRASSINPA